MKCNHRYMDVAFLLTTILLSSMIFQRAASLPRGLRGDETPNSGEFGKLSLSAASLRSAVGNPSIPRNTSICFPYFISLDIEGLLAQANEMLNKAVNPRQKSWLQFFVARLNSLSKQLKDVPVENKNMCFLKRQKFFAEAMLPVNPYKLTPAEQLRFAKEVFDVPREIDELHLKENHDRVLREDMQLEDLSSIASKFLQNGKINQRIPKQDSILLQKQHGDLEMDAEHENQPSFGMRMPFPMVHEETGNKQVVQELPHATPSSENPFISNIYPETMPFLSRSTRKIIRMNILERYKKKHLALKPFIFGSPNQAENVDSRNSANTLNYLNATVLHSPVNNFNNTSSENYTQSDSLSTSKSVLPTHLIEHHLNRNLDSVVPIDDNSYDEAVAELHANEHIALTSASSAHTTPYGSSQTGNLNASNAEHKTKTEIVPEAINYGSEFATQNQMTNTDVIVGSNSYGAQNEVQRPGQENDPVFNLLSPFPVKNAVSQEFQDSDDDDAAQQLKALRFSGMKRNSVSIDEMGNVH